MKYLVELTEDQVKTFPLYEKYNLKVQSDYAVGFYRSTFREKTCYFIDHSCI